MRALDTCSATTKAVIMRKPGAFGAGSLTSTIGHASKIGFRAVGPAPSAPAPVTPSAYIGPLCFCCVRARLLTGAFGAGTLAGDARHVVLSLSFGDLFGSTPGAFGAGTALT